MRLAFTVYGVAQPKGSMRAFQRPGMRVPIVTDGNRNVQGWQRLIASAACAALEELACEDRLLVVGGVRIEVAYYLPRPKALDVPKYRGVEVAHTKKPDIDKLTRAVLDALTAVVFADDAQVVELVTTKRYAAAHEPARVEIAVAPSRLGVPPLLEELHA